MAEMAAADTPAAEPETAAPDAEDEDAEIPESDKTPFTIITGFLGAGKTTLINYILTEQRQKRICIVENEFGEINIDEKLVVDQLQSKEDLVTMDNGCACCSVRGDLIKTLGGLVERRKQFDAVFLETTGLADPAPIISTIKSNPWIDDNFKIDAVVCVADAKHVKEHLDEIKPDGAVNEAVQQVVFADRILLNKCDLVTPEELQAIKDTLTSINHFAEVIECTRSKIADLGRIIGINSFNVDRCVELDPTFFDDADDMADEEDCEDPECTDEHHGHDHAHAHGHSEPAADKPKKRKKKVHDLSMVSSCGIKIKGNFDVVKFNTFMGTLLQERAKDIYRSKGVLSFEGQGDQKFVFQGVHEQIDFGPASSPWAADEPRENKLVFIGRNLSREELDGKLRECLV